MQRISSIALIIVALCVPTPASAMGSDHGKEPINNDKWPAGLAGLVNVDGRVHGYWVNWEDVLFFSGDTSALNAFLAKYAALPNTKLDLIIHPGKLEVKSPWDKEPRNIVANWQLYTSPFAREQVEAGAVKPGPFITRLEVWLGDSIKLSDLRVPPNVPATSGGEIEAFVKQHQSPTTAPSTNR